MVTFGAISMIFKPFSVISNTPRSVITLSTTAFPVRGRVHCGMSFGITVFIGMVHNYNHAFHAGYQVHRAAHAFNQFPGDHPVGEVALVSETSNAPSRQKSIWPPRIMANESALEKYDAPLAGGDGLFAGVD